ncbi:S41 family peptidase [Dinghuibacter silviterrae]|uniref:C-terminal processing protease CtpA/Prc n=1 Tax=Dinghuibacter silviterrae TaxID=1539049 RepID=A0A4R8DX55_9BACT|nr:S41 family peptidase [Dinghuibacter silviterrae]TDX02115.1 C-terminal processing protease CtpA/Prc [Dinghuibacter silviterrae]
MRSLFLLSLLILAEYARPQTPPYDPARLYSKEALKRDLRFLQANLEKTHPGIYRYIAKPTLDGFFDSLDHAITGPMTDQAFLSLVTLLNSNIRNGHTMFLPGDSAMAFFYQSERHFPLLVHYSRGKLTVVENYSTDSTIQPGMSILTINGTSASSIMEQLLSRQVRDGYNETYPAWILNHYFSAQYSFVVGHPDAFTLELENGAGERTIKRIPSLTRDSVHYFRQIRYATNSEPIFFQVKENAAVLTIKTFDPDVLQDYKKVFDSVFSLLQQHLTRNLILDLRDNQGGDFPPGKDLLSFVALHPCRFLVDGKEACTIQPSAIHFTGKLFVLINGGSFSSTAIVCTCLKRDRRAVFIGEETGGNAHIIAGDPEEFVLPQTKIRAEIPTVTYRISAGVNDGHGVLPDYPVTTTIDDIIAGRDPSMELAMKLVEGNQ